MMMQLTTQVLSGTTQKIRKLHHISDIHIRLYQRLEEYEHVFERFYEFLRQQEGHHDLIVITGDLLHHKNELSPECIVFTASFLRRLAELFPVILIAGNHDALLNNASRMDSISAIAPSVDGLHYLKASGWYQYDDVVFGVSSILDGMMTPCPKPEDVGDDKTKVALFHGGVGRFSTGKGFMMDGIPCTTFDGYDMVLLGDIHLHQYLDKDKRIAYAGSMISQNFSETDEDHGVLVWDVATRQSQLHRLDNPYAFCEAVLEPPYVIFRGVKQNIDMSVFPPQARLRVTMKERTSEYLDAVVSLRKKVALLSEKVAEPLLIMSATPSDQPPSSIDLTAWVRRFFEERAVGWSTDEKETIMEIVMPHMRVSPQDDGDCTWELMELEFSHMFGYGENNLIKFKTFPLYETVGVFGDNSAGKSSLLEILVFLLYGHITRYSHGISTPREVIHFCKNKSSGRVRFMVRGNVFEVEKHMTLNRLGKVKVDEKLWRLGSDGTRVDMSEEQRKKTDGIVSGLIGPMDHFLFTTIFLQQNESSFRGMSPKERKEFLYGLMGLNRLDGIWSETMDAVRLEKRDSERLETSLRNMPSMADLEKEMKTLTQKLATNGESQKIGEMKIRTLKREMLRLVEEKRHVPDDWRELRQKWWERKKQVDEEMRNLSPVEGTEKEWEELRTDAWERLEFLYSMRKVLPEMPPLRSFDHPCPPPVRLEDYDENKHEEWKGIFESHPMMEQVELDRLRQARDALLIRKVSVEEEKDERAMDLDQLTHTLREKKERLAFLGDGPSRPSDSLNEEIDQLTNTMDEMESKWGQCWAKASMLPCLQFQEKECAACRHNKEALFMEDHIIRARQDWEQMRQQVKTLKQEWVDARKREEEQKILTRDVEHVSSVINNRMLKKQLSKIDGKIDSAQRHLAKQEEMKQMDEQWQVVAALWRQKRVIEKENLTIDNEIQEKKKVKEQADLALESIRAQRKGKEELDELLREQEMHVQWEEDSLRNARLEKQRQQKSELEEKEESALKQFMQEAATLDQKVLQCKEKVSERNALSLKFDKTRKRIAQLEKLEHVTSRDGLPMFLLERILPTIEGEINKIIEPFLPNKKLILRKEKKKENVSILLSVETLSTESIYLGGMEAFILDVAMKIAFARMSRQPRSNVFFIDEGISALDKKNMENLDQLFQFLELHFPHVFVISHLREATSYVRRSIYIEKQAEYSRLRLL